MPKRISKSKKISSNEDIDISIENVVKGYDTNRYSPVIMMDTDKDAASNHDSRNSKRIDRSDDTIDRLGPSRRLEKRPKIIQLESSEDDSSLSNFNTFIQWTQPSNALSVLPVISLTKDDLSVNYVDDEENDTPLNDRVIEIDAQITKTKIMHHILSSSSSSSPSSSLQSECPDIECLSQNFRLSLICPITNKKLTVPARAKLCEHITCFDLEAYHMINKNKKQNKWKCPICQTNAPFDDLVTDGLIKTILKSTKDSCKAVNFLFRWTPEVIDDDGNKSQIDEIVID